jgi:hypothetical protein
VQTAEKANVTLEYLEEAFLCIGQQAAARMFSGRSARGDVNSLSAATLLNWQATFRYVLDNPDKEDSDAYQARVIEKKGNEWDDYVKLIKMEIPPDVVKSWEMMSQRKQGDEAEKYGLRIGIRNAKTISTLLDRMKEMVERRRTRIWSVAEKPVPQEIEKINYNHMNIFALRDLSKKKGLINGGKKDELIARLERHDEEKSSGVITPEKPRNYQDMSSLEMKNLAKERGLAAYNNLTRAGLMKIHLDLDEEEKLKQQQQQNEEKILTMINLTQADVDAEKMEMEYDATQHSNRCCLYIAYIGNGLIKVGYSDCRLLQREEKHMSCESEYPQFRLIGSFEISSRLIETQIHSLLSRWRIAYKNQKEIYKIDSNLQSFLDRIKALLEEYDLQLQISRYKIENLELKKKILEKEKEIMELTNKIKEL